MTPWRWTTSDARRLSTQDTGANLRGSPGEETDLTMIELGNGAWIEDLT